MATADDRTPGELLRQYDRLTKVKRELIKSGVLNGDARPDGVIAALRQLIPVEMFPRQKPPIISA